MDGLNVHFAGVDEVHEHPNPEIIQKLNTATGARRQPLIFEISTAGHDRHSVCRQHHDLREVAYDRTFAGEIVQNLQDEGVKLVEFGQGFLSLAAPTAELERLSVSRALWHGGHPVLRWNASNVAVRQDPAGNIKPDKERSTERIDGISALVNALGRALVRDSTGGRSIYENQGLVFL